MTDEENLRRQTIEILENADKEDSYSICIDFYKLCRLYGIELPGES